MPRRGQQGMTLLELLVALSIFALIGVACYRVLTTVVTAESVTARHSEQLATLQRALWRLQLDVEQYLERPVRGPLGAEQPALSVGQEDELPLLLTRGGLLNPLELPRSRLRRVGYSVGLHPDYEDEDSRYYGDETRYLLRWFWEPLDGSGAEERAAVQALLPAVETMDVQVISERGAHPVWPPPGNNRNNAQDPRALRVTLTLEGGQPIERWIKLL